MQVAPTDNGEVVRTDKTLRDPSGFPLGREETVRQVETLPDRATLSSIEDFW